MHRGVRCYVDAGHGADEQAREAVIQPPQKAKRPNLFGLLSAEKKKTAEPLRAETAKLSTRDLYDRAFTATHVHRNMRVWGCVGDGSSWVTGPIRARRAVVELGPRLLHGACRTLRSGERHAQQLQLSMATVRPPRGV